MFIANLEEVVDQLKPKLKSYLEKQLGHTISNKAFPCYIHEDSSPSMSINPKTNYTTVHCFGCGQTQDIFAAAATLESLPTSGSDWIEITIPTLAERFNVKIIEGALSEADKERVMLYRLTSDIASLLEFTDEAKEYIAQRSWSDTYVTIGQINPTTLMEELDKRGYNTDWVRESAIPNLYILFGTDKLTFAIEDKNGKPIGFISRNLNDGVLPKYINSSNNAIYHKGSVLFGLSNAIKTRNNTLYIVEGPGDVLAANNKDITNIVGVCGTALTTEHLLSLRANGFTDICLALDWDDAGQNNIKRILQDQSTSLVNITCTVLKAPSDSNIKDLSQFFETNDLQAFEALEKQDMFPWLLEHSDEQGERLALKMLPAIAIEPSAVKRDRLARDLAHHTSVSLNAILDDVNELRNGRAEERNRRTLASLKKYNDLVRESPEDSSAALTQHEIELEEIDKEFNKSPMGPDAQLSRYNSIEHSKLHDPITKRTFIFTKYGKFQEAFSGALPFTEGVLGYVGGKAHHGKTALVTDLTVDVAFSDPDARVIAHYTDDSYIKIAPRYLTAFASMIQGDDPPILTIGMFSNPKAFEFNKLQEALYNDCNNIFRSLLQEGKLTIIDAENGSTLSTLEKYLRYNRKNYPSDKLWVMADNTHNYLDFGHLERTDRMTQISTLQKNFADKYKCMMIATAEYKKGLMGSSKELHLPVDEDLADARALTYRPDFIIHTYNDLKARDDNATIFWVDPKNPTIKHPRIMAIISKNKIAGHVDKLMYDLNKDTICLTEVDVELARREADLVEAMLEQKSIEEQEELPRMGRMKKTNFNM